MRILRLLVVATLFHTWTDSAWATCPGSLGSPNLGFEGKAGAER